MAHHLEFVFGPLGEETRLACSCPRGANHLRPNSESRIADEFDGRLVAAAAAATVPPRAQRVRARRHGQHRSRFTFAAASAPRARHAA
ncbi:hypothetical protein PX701_07580 [Agromyces sp. H3Y2-19a]|jgi:hypothetical protein|uniref:hypothetical protein n=1 Tax=Agromyces TaxID=33877 RepID=UPI001E50648C|nr:MULTISPECIES: hypothetical protein [Agromyces]MCD5345364.1 hypothetical protein [Agromyces sp. S2-1-8]MDF0513477.1 hypothetical protein [Agromyces chromiiresistens]